MGLSPGLEPNPRLSRAAQLAFYVTLGAAVVRCAQQSEPQVVAIAPPPASTHAPRAEDAAASDATSDAVLDAQRSGRIAIYGAPYDPILDVLSFELGRTDVGPGSRLTLESIAEIMKDRPLVIEVRGHADSKEKGHKLAERRAKAVKKALVALGVAEDRLVIRDLGATEPLSPEPHKNAYVNFRIVEQPDTD